jgi:hypothetical protein
MALYSISFILLNAVSLFSVIFFYLAWRFVFLWHCYGDQVKTDDMVGECSVHGEGETYM